MDNRRKNPILLNGFLVVICIILFVALAGILVWNYKSEAQEKERLESISRTETQGGQQEQGQEEDTAPAQPEEEQQDAVPEEATPEETVPEEEQEVNTPAEGISFWGDEFYTGDEAAAYSYKAVTQRILSENGYELQMADKTLVGASTLSMMKMAGVDQAEIDGYITAHQEAANGAELPITETGIRDLTEDQMNRYDADYLPVLFMGYYGGWNHDPQELIDQQQKILDTFGAHKDKFVIIGLVPLDGSVDLDTYDGAMKEAWGEHYISSAEVTLHSQATHEGQEEIANALYSKLVELNYINKD